MSLLVRSFYAFVKSATFFLFTFYYCIILFGSWSRIALLVRAAYIKYVRFRLPFSWFRSFSPPIFYRNYSTFVIPFLFTFYPVAWCINEYICPWLESKRCVTCVLTTPDPRACRLSIASNWYAILYRGNVLLPSVQLSAACWSSMVSSVLVVLETKWSYLSGKWYTACY